ncbi:MULTISPECIES: catalase family peroxidase [Methylophaga]|jgi:catalase|uniref:catalase family peroxidase n=1 Tax=Methylophaga TaxID=40222 RepID=UPI0023551186|nr:MULTISPECIES: catalase family peroxidase [Methylophaga]
MATSSSFFMNTLLMSSLAFFPVSPSLADDDTDKPVVEQLVDTLSTIAGPHPGIRKNHAKGIVVLGEFTPSSEASSVSTAEHLQSASTPVTIRFSNTTGIPDIADTNPSSFPKGIAIRFQLADNSYTDIVSISVNRFPAATPEDFLGLLNAVAASAPDTPAPKPITQFLASHPAAKTFVEIEKPAPVSFATQPFYGVNAFKFTNKEGEVNYGRYQIIPVNGPEYLTDEQRAAAGDNYLFEELPQRLKQSKAEFILALQLAEKGDEVNDPTMVWPETRQLVKLGTLTIESIDPNGEQFAKQTMFNPLALTDGIEASKDPILLARPSAYAISYGRRLAGQ